MDKASGWSLRFASWVLWAAGLACCLQTCSTWLLAPLIGTLRTGTASLFSLSVYLHMAPGTALVVLPGVLHWWLAMDKATPQSAAWLLQHCRKVPLWDTLLWLRTPARATKAIAFLLSSAVASVLFVNNTLSSPAFQANTTPAPLCPPSLSAPVGLIAAAVILSLQLDRPRLQAIHQLRSVRLRALAHQIVTTAALTALLSATLVTTVAILSPTPLPSVLDGLCAAAAALSFTTAQLSAAVLTGLVLAERPGLAVPDSADQSAVRSLKLAVCHA